MMTLATETVLELDTCLTLDVSYVTWSAQINFRMLYKILKKLISVGPSLSIMLDVGFCF